MMKPLLGLLCGVLLCLSQGACQPHYQNTDRAAMNKIPLKPTCVGRYMISLPSGAPQEWTQDYGDYFKVDRLPYSVNTVDKFTALVEQRRDELAKASHDTEGHLLSEYRQTSPNSWLLLSRDNAVDIYTYNVERYVWTGHWGYRFAKGIATKKRALIDAEPDPLNDLVPIDNFTPPSQSGFCMDGAMVTAAFERGSTGPDVKIPGWKKSKISILVTEHQSEEDSDNANASFAKPIWRTFYWLDDDKNRFNEVRHMFAPEASGRWYPTKFDVLRRRELTLGGRLGQEAVWKTVDRRGDVVYRFEWDSIDELQNKDLPALVIRMDIGSYQEQDVIPTPPEADLFALWDAVLPTLHKR
jgi:hypothetical protein